MRDVTPSGVSRVYQPITLAPVAPVIPTQKFAGARMQNDGSILADGRVVKLKDITFPARNLICGLPGSARWGCGLRAHAAAWLALENKALECEKPAGEADPRAPMHVTCWIERKDFALTLLERGWVYLAESSIDQKYAAAASAARTNRVGLWAEGPTEQTQKPKRPLAIP